MMRKYLQYSRVVFTLYSMFSDLWVTLADAQPRLLVYCILAAFCNKIKPRVMRDK